MQLPAISTDSFGTQPAGCFGQVLLHAWWHGTRSTVFNVTIVLHHSDVMWLHEVHNTRASWKESTT